MSGPHATGKGDRRRPSSISRDERELRDRVWRGLITFVEFEDKYRELLKAGKITRDGKVVRP
jgi:hypothetical protein